MLGTKRILRRLGFAVVPSLLISLAATAQTVQPGQTTGAASSTGQRSIPQAPVGHRQPRAADIPAPLEKTAADLERERKERELDRRLRICRNC